MAKLMNIGFGNMVNTDKIVSIISSDSAPAKRMISRGKEQEILIDATQGRRTKSVKQQVYQTQSFTIQKQRLKWLLKHFVT